MAQTTNATHIKEDDLLNMLHGKASSPAADVFSVLVHHLDMPTPIYFGDKMVLASRPRSLSRFFDRLRKNLETGGYKAPQVEVLSWAFVRAGQVRIDLNWITFDNRGAGPLTLRAQYFCVWCSRRQWRISMVAFADRLPDPLAEGLPIQ